MNVTIELRYGPHGDQIVTQENMQRTLDAMGRAIVRANGEDSTLLTDARSILAGIQRQLPTSRRHRPVEHRPRVDIPDFTRAGNGLCTHCGREYRDHQAIRYTDDPANDPGLILFLLCDRRVVKL
jgi:hypothetical protein